MSEAKKPPLGIMPRQIWMQKRFDDLIDATDRFKRASTTIPREWYKEIGDLALELTSENNVPWIDIEEYKFHKRYMNALMEQVTYKKIVDELNDKIHHLENIGLIPSVIICEPDYYDVMMRMFNAFANTEQKLGDIVFTKVSIMNYFIDIMKNDSIKGFEVAGYRKKTKDES